MTHLIPYYEPRREYQLIRVNVSREMEAANAAYAKETKKDADKNDAKIKQLKERYAAKTQEIMQEPDSEVRASVLDAISKEECLNILDIQMSHDYISYQKFCESAVQCIEINDREYKKSKKVEYKIHKHDQCHVLNTSTKDLLANASEYIKIK